MVPTLSSHSASQSRESHVSEDIPRVLPCPKSQDGNARWVCERGSFTAVAGAASDIRVVVSLRVAAACATSTTASTAAASTISYNFCHRRQLNSHGLRATGIRDTSCRAPHVTLSYDGSEGGVQAQWAVVGK